MGADGAEEPQCTSEWYMRIPSTGRPRLAVSAVDLLAAFIQNRQMVPGLDATAEQLRRGIANDEALAVVLDAQHVLFRLHIAPVVHLLLAHIAGATSQQQHRNQGTSEQRL